MRALERARVAELLRLVNCRAYDLHNLDKSVGLEVSHDGRQDSSGHLRKRNETESRIKPDWSVDGALHCGRGASFVTGTSDGSLCANSKEKHFSHTSDGFWIQHQSEQSRN